MGTIREIVFDCERPSALACFWAEVLDGYRVRPYDAEEIARLAAIGLSPETDPTVMVDGPGPLLCFQQARERKIASDPAKSRLHLDVSVRDRRGEVERLCALGASVRRETEGYTVLLDPEGNAFCVTDRAGAP
jgi:hypothetical protein